MAAGDPATFAFARLSGNHGDFAFFKPSYVRSQKAPEFVRQISTQNLKTGQRIGVQGAEMIALRVKPHAGVGVFIHLHEANHGEADLRC